MAKENQQGRLQPMYNEHSCQNSPMEIPRDYTIHIVFEYPNGNTNSQVVALSYEFPTQCRISIILDYMEVIDSCFIIILTVFDAQTKNLPRCMSYMILGCNLIMTATYTQNFNLWCGKQSNDGLVTQFKSFEDEQ